MDNPEQFYYELKESIRIAKLEYDAILYVANRERLWQGNEYVHGRPVEDVASTFEESAKIIKLRIVTLEAKLPCEEFTQRFGYFLHEKYREKYPINRNTTLVRWDIPHAEAVYYQLQEPINIFDFTLDSPPPIVFTETRSARFERWATIDFSIDVKLAYAHETNMVYWMNL